MSGSAPPGLTVQFNGQACLVDEYLNGLVQGGALLADLRDFVGLSNMNVWMIGAASVGDGNQGMFVWDSLAISADDGGLTTIQPYGILVGRWIRQGALISGPITQLSTGKFYENYGAVIDRLNDRVFVGGATVNDGDYPNVIQDWLTATPSLGWPVFTAQMAVLSDSNQIALTTASRTSDQAPYGNNEGNGSCIGIGTWAINDYSDPTNTRDAWALYIEARHAQVNKGVTWGVELDIMAYGGHLEPATPYTYYVPYGAIGLDIASGAGQPEANDATVALQIANNSAKFLSGIIFDANAITGADGTATGGSGEAIAMARGHCINWYSPEGNRIVTIESLATDLGGVQTFTFGDSGMTYTSAGAPVAGFATSTPALGFTNFSILLHNSTSGEVYQQVFLGAADSGGSGMRALVVPN